MERASERSADSLVVSPPFVRPFAPYNCQSLPFRFPPIVYVFPAANLLSVSLHFPSFSLQCSWKARMWVRGSEWKKTAKSVGEKDIACSVRTRKEIARKEGKSENQINRERERGITEPSLKSWYRNSILSVAVSWAHVRLLLSYYFAKLSSRAKYQQEKASNGSAVTWMKKDLTSDCNNTMAAGVGDHQAVNL